MYHRKNLTSSKIARRGTGDIGYAGELIVRTDLLLRGLNVTVPENRSCPDDVHFRSLEGWVSVQVKVATVNLQTGRWYCRLRGKKITSDILACVNLRSREIRYAPNTKPVPKELLT